MGQERQVLSGAEWSSEGSPPGTSHQGQPKPAQTPLGDFFRGMGLAGGATIGIMLAIILIICGTCFACVFIGGLTDDGAFQNRIEQLK